jgi:hypothetical protein
MAENTKSQSGTDKTAKDQMAKGMAEVGKDEIGKTGKKDTTQARTIWSRACRRRAGTPPPPTRKAPATARVDQSREPIRRSCCIRGAGGSWPYQSAGL